MHFLPLLLHFPAFPVHLSPPRRRSGRGSGSCAAGNNADDVRRVNYTTRHATDRQMLFRFLHPTNNATLVVKLLLDFCFTIRRSVYSFYLMFGGGEDATHVYVVKLLLFLLLTLKRDKRLFTTLTIVN